MRFFILIFIITLLDQFSKFYIQKKMFLGMSIPIVSDFFHITYILNAGAAFGILENHRWLFIVIAIILLFVCIIFYKQITQEKVLTKYGIACFIGGAIGNLIDRIRIGKVIDFFDFRIWPIFNIADIAICLGAFLILWSIIVTENTKTTT